MSKETAPWEADYSEDPVNQNQEQAPWEMDHSTNDIAPWDVKYETMPNHEGYGVGNFSKPELDLTGNTVITQKGADYITDEVGDVRTVNGIRDGYKPDGSIDASHPRWKKMTPKQILDTMNEEKAAGMVDGHLVNSDPSYDINAQGSGVSKESDVRQRMEVLSKKNPKLSKNEIRDKAESDQLIDGLATTAQAALVLTPVGQGLVSGVGLGALAGAGSSLIGSGADALKDEGEFLSQKTAVDAVFGGLLGGSLGGVGHAIPHLTKLAKGYTKGMEELIDVGSKTRTAQEGKNLIKNRRQNGSNTAEDFMELRRHNNQISKTEEVMAGVTELQTLKKHDGPFRRVDVNPQKLAEYLDDPQLSQMVVDAAPALSKLAANVTKKTTKPTILSSANTIAKEIGKGRSGAEALLKVADDAKSHWGKMATDKLGITKTYSSHSKELASAKRLLDDPEIKKLVEKVPELSKATQLLKKGDFEKASAEILKTIDNVSQTGDPRKLKALEQFMTELDDTVELASRGRTPSQLLSDYWPTAIATYLEPITAITRPALSLASSTRNSQYLNNVKQAVSGSQKFADDYHRVMKKEMGPLSTIFNQAFRGKEVVGDNKK